MSLRAYTFGGDGGRKSPSRRAARRGTDARWALVKMLLPFFIPLAGLFPVLAARVMINSEAERWHRRAETLRREMHYTEREIRNLGSQIAHQSRRQFIFKQVERFQLPLRHPNMGQVRHVASGASALDAARSRTSA